MQILTSTGGDLGLALAAMAFFAVGLVLAYVVLPLYGSITRGARASLPADPTCSVSIQSD